MAPEGPVPLGRSRVPVYRSGALSSMEADHSCHIGFGDKNGRFGEMRKRRMRGPDELRDIRDFSRISL
jgi:hypothetical protein